MKIKITETQLKNIQEEMGGEGGIHPRYGEMNFSKMDPEEVIGLTDTDDGYDDWFDYDYVLDSLREYGWGDISPAYFEEFEDYFHSKWGDEKYENLLNDEDLYATYLDNYLRKSAHGEMGDFNIGTL
jgi:hypothetical protein